MLLVGVAALAVGGFFLGENRLRPPRASSLLAIGLLAVGMGFLVTGIIGTPETISASDFEPAPDAPVRLAVTSDTQASLPYLITNEGDLLQPGNDGAWTKLPLDAPVRDVYVDVNNTLWASTDAGLYTHQDGAWAKLSDQASKRTLVMHGYVFALEDEGIFRAPVGGGDLDKPLQLSIPLADQSVENLVMLGDHSHILQNGSGVFLTDDLGLSWETINAPETVDAIGVDPNGDLLAVTDAGIQRWSYADQTWTAALPLPGGDTQPVLRVYVGQLYALGNGQLYQQVGTGWEVVDIGASGEFYLTALEYQYPRTLWVLDAKGRRLWSTVDGQNWTETGIQVK